MTVKGKEANRRTAAAFGRWGDLLDYARRLEQLGHRVHAFVNEQLAGLEAILRRHPHGLPAGEAAGAASAEFERQRQTWERQRRDEVRRIEEERALLTEAWVRLESEQRKLLGQRESMLIAPTAAPTEAAPHEPHWGHPAPPSSAVAAPAPAESHAPATAERAGPSGDDTAPESVLLQFQQLKSEVRRHSERRHRR